MTDVEELMECLRIGDTASITALLARRPGLARSHNPQGVSLICLAVYMGQQSSAELLAKGRSDLDIFEASVLGRTDRVAALIKESPLLKDAYSPDGFHPLGYACFFGKRELFDALIGAGAGVNAPARNPMKVCPLHSAAASPDPELALYMVRVLLEKGADVNATQQGGFTALHEAAHRGHPDLVGVLIAGGADRGLRNHEGHDAGMLARLAGHNELAASLAPGPEV